MDASLVMFKADGTRRDFPLTKSRTVIGRINSCDMRIPLTSVSREHCEIKINGDKIRVRDLGSSNGTYINSNRITETTLNPGDEIGIGPVVFTIVIDGRPKEIEPVHTILEKDAGGGGREPAAEKSAPPTLEMDEDIADLDEADLVPDDDQLLPLADSDGAEAEALAALEGALMDDTDAGDTSIDADKLDDAELELVEDDAAALQALAAGGSEDHQGDPPVPNDEQDKASKASKKNAESKKRNK